MLKAYTTVLRDGNGEYEEKKSRFISYLCPVDSEEEIEEILKRIRKQYYDARHNCYAYVLGDRKKAADDGEPSGTAGYPILSVLEGRAVTNALLVVTRYFGGTLLGTGGLVRSYTNAAKDAMEHAVLIDKIPADLMEIRTDYQGLGKLQYLFAKEELPEPEITYYDRVLLKIPIPAERTAELQKKITDQTQGKAEIEITGQCFYARCGRETLFFEK